MSPTNNELAADAMFQLRTCWHGMRQRCNNPRQPAYRYYGGRGITVCDEWQQNFGVFLAWSLENGFRRGLTIDRIDNDKGYSPDNCRWVSMSVQAHNRRKFKGQSKYIGVSPTRGSRFRAFVTCQRVLHIIGVFKSEIAAAKAYDIEARKCFGDAANVNFKNGEWSDLDPEKFRSPRGQRMRAVTISGETKSLAGWGEVLGITRERARQLHNEGRLVERVRESRKATP